MKVCNIKEIYDNGEFISIITISETVIHLPVNEKHSITLVTDNRNNVDALIEFKEG